MNGSAEHGQPENRHHVQRGQQLSQHLSTAQLIKRERGKNSGLHYVFCGGRLVVGERLQYCLGIVAFLTGACKLQVAELLCESASCRLVHTLFQLAPAFPTLPVCSKQKTF